MLTATPDLAGLTRASDNKILLFVMDGVGGLPHPSTGLTELEAAQIPTLDRLATEGSLALCEVAMPGLTCGSGPGHLALFGYDPLEHDVQRGVLEALGVNFDLRPGDLCARGNYCTVAESGDVADRRAGPLSTERNREVSALLVDQVSLPGHEFHVLPGKEHRFALVLRGPGLSGPLAETDPQRTGEPPHPIRALAPQAEGAAAVLTSFLDQARAVLAGEPDANFLLLRGLGNSPDLPAFPERYGVRALAVATYPMYRGITRLLGFDVPETGPGLDEQVQTVRENLADHDFVYFHVKETDSAGHAGDYDRKVRAHETADAALRELAPLFHTVVVSGDHCTPTGLLEHSWHPVPSLIHGPTVMPDLATAYSERACMQGGLGRPRTKDLLPLALAHALRLSKFGA